MSNSKIRRSTAALSLAIAAIALGGCGGGNYPGDPASTMPDGSYQGQSAPESDGSYGVVNFTVQYGRVTNASFMVYDKDGTPHDDQYGLGAGGQPVDQAFYQRAQNAIAAEKQYVTSFVDSGDQSEVESVAGASLSYRLFRDAVSDAVTNPGE